MDSYLPEELSFSKVVGVGMNHEELQANPRLTDTLVQNLNDMVRCDEFWRACLFVLANIVEGPFFRHGVSLGVGEGDDVLGRHKRKFVHSLVWLATHCPTSLLLRCFVSPCTCSVFLTRDKGGKHP